MRDLTLRETDRGFVLFEFTDQYGERCSLHESSLASEPAVWLGQNKPTKLPDGDLACRMHLTRHDARMLSDLLRHFADFGRLPRTAAIK